MPEEFQPEEFQPDAAEFAESVAWQTERNISLLESEDIIERSSSRERKVKPYH